MADFQLIVNGVEHEISGIDPGTPLLWVLRDHLGMTGTKYGCGRGLCGACTVHVNGHTTRSCSLRLDDAANSEVTTIEGLADDAGNLHPLQQAWVDLAVPQCGFCQAGQIMSACVLIQKEPNPDDEAIDAGMSGNICRCGTYPRIRAAIKQAAEAVK